MPSTYTYPGVYLEEVASGVRTIAGVSTSDTAFIDFFKKGPLNTPVRVTTFGDFERTFGGLDKRSAGSYAIQQYYLNGGQIAYVVRVGSGGTKSSSAALAAGAGTITFSAKSEGEWGRSVRYKITQTGATFTLDLIEGPTDQEKDALVKETFPGLSMTATSSRYAPALVSRESQLVDLVAAGDTNGLPANVANYTALTGGGDGDVPGANTWTTTNGITALTGTPAAQTGIYSLDKIAPFVFNLLCIPAAADLEDADMKAVYLAAATYCVSKRAFLLVDIPVGTDTVSEMETWMGGHGLGDTAVNAAVYFPRLEVPDILNGGNPKNVGASGTMAGVYARTDASRGVWKAPAGTDASLRNANVAVKVNDLNNGVLNQLGANVLRSFPIYGNISWGARTLRGADALGSEYKYIPVRRTALYIMESLYQGLKWVVFEPNDEPLWAQIRLNVGAFLNGMFREGAFQGRSSREAYFVKCDRETTTQNDINRGVVNILVGFAPLKPAEFVVIKIQQIAGQVET